MLFTLFSSLYFIIQIFSSEMWLWCDDKVLHLSGKNFQKAILGNLVQFVMVLF